jgi:hypothetical protein
MKKYRLIHQNSNIEVPEGRLDIGRSVECYLVLDDPSVSRIHATMINDGDRLLLEDRGSRNGCVVNGTRVTGTTELRDGDRVAIGHQTIRIVTLDRGFDAERTLGLIGCKKCGSWMATTDERCPQCGTPTASGVPDDAKATMGPADVRARAVADAVRKTQQPQMMIGGLMRKAIGMEKYEEADRLMGNLMEMTIKREKAGQAVPDEELSELTANLFALAEATRNPKHISGLFAFYHARGKLLPRETIEELYNLVRKVGYRACPEMTRYLAFLASRTATFTPGEKFIHRRLEGLVGVCS